MVADTTYEKITITDYGKGIGDYSMTSDKVYILDGLVFVNGGQTLNIQAGTIIKGQSGQGENASALVVARGGTINATGTAAKPIIFTSNADNSTPLAMDNALLSSGVKGLWGGVIIIGNATTNRSTEGQVEGIPTSESRGVYGGTNDNDNSGTFQYVSIRHGGTEIGAGNEINGLSLYAVGSGTTIDHVEVIYNKDDGVEWFGGTVNTKYLAVAFCGDDSYDYDEGFRGKGQFWFTMKDASGGDRGGEHDGGTKPEDGTPYAHPIVYNATFIGRDTTSGKRTITFRDNAGGEYHNSVFYNFSKGIDIENLASGEDSYARFQAGTLILANNVFWHVVSTGATGADIFKVSVDTTGTAAFAAYFSTAGNSVANTGISRNGNTSFNPIPTGNANSGVASTDNFFSNVTHQGAFNPTTETTTNNWLSGWSVLGSMIQ